LAASIKEAAMIIKHVIVCALVLALLTTGCTSIRTLDGPYLDRLNTGEIVTIYKHAGQVSRLTVREVTESEIIGTRYGSSVPVSINRNDISAVEVERVDYAKSVAAGVGGVIGAAAVVMMTGFILLLTAYGG
jgi:hypothetical protein